MIRDRGKIKWTAMMLPEHKDLINKMYDRIYHKVEKPFLSEDRLAEFDKIVHEAYVNKKQLKFSVYENKRITEISGEIVKINYHKKSLIINSDDGFKEIKTNSIIEINLTV
ncbi:MAG: YolD-like family protein [Clostridia bacterium]|nr:YolD-like family protein [Clostridia bacterium]